MEAGVTFYVLADCWCLAEMKVIVFLMSLDETLVWKTWTSRHSEISNACFVRSRLYIKNCTCTQSLLHWHGGNFNLYNIVRDQGMSHCIHEINWKVFAANSCYSWSSHLPSNKNRHRLINFSCSISSIFKVI